MQRITTEQDIDTLFRADLAMLYKHSPTCGVCTAALRAVEAFRRQLPDAKVYVVDVLAQRALSQRIAAHAGVRHESPQVILFRRGKAEWNTSHYGITAAALAEQFERARR